MRVLIIILAIACMGFTKDNTIKRDEPIYNAQYKGQKDRYNVNSMKHDPEVLVSTPNVKQELTIVAQDKLVEPPVIVKTCWDFGNGCEPKE